MFYAYVLKSVGNDYYYKGHCQNLEKRLEQHNSGMTKSIRPYIPVRIVYSEEFETEKETILRLLNLHCFFSTIPVPVFG